MTRLHSNVHQRSSDDSVLGQDSTSSADAANQQDGQIDFGSNITGPVLMAAAPPAGALYLTETGNAAAISVDDIHQGQLGDCFLLSAFGEEALFHPAAISNMIHDNGSGTESVTLYLDRNGRPPGFFSTGFKPTTVTVDNIFSPASVNSGATQDVVGNLKEIWPQVVEKAVATLGGGIGSIAYGGYPVVALEELTGHSAISISPYSLTFAVLTQHIAAGDLMVMDTASWGGLPYGLVSNHAYMFERMNGSGASATIQLHNPWGFDQPAAIPLSRLTQSGIVEIDIGRAA